MSQSVQVNQVENFHKLAFLDKKLHQGRAVININGGYFLNKEGEQGAINHLVHTFGEAINYSPVKGDNSIILFVYLKQYTTDKISQTFVLSLTAMLARLYPETLYQCYLCDAGSSFKTILTALTALLSKESRKKLIFSKS